ncbi:MAG: DUF2490 domain-containing protein [Gemmatimonadota bacterium]
MIRTIGWLVVVTVLGWVFYPPVAYAQDDFLTWHAVTGQYAKPGKWTLGVAGELRFDDDSSHLCFIRATHMARYQWRDDLAFDGNVSYMRQRLVFGPEIDNVRAELALTPRWKLGQRTQFDVRNQLELWWREGDVADDVLYRVYPRFVFQLGGSSRARALIVGNELLFAKELDGLFQNRFYPIGVTLAVGRGWVDVYTMVFSNDLPAGDWVHGFVVGQNWRF